MSCSHHSHQLNNKPCFRHFCPLPGSQCCPRKTRPQWQSWASLSQGDAPSQKQVIKKKETARNVVFLGVALPVIIIVFFFLETNHAQIMDEKPGLGLQSGGAI